MYFFKIIEIKDLFIYRYSLHGQFLVDILYIVVNLQIGGIDMSMLLLYVNESGYAIDSLHVFRIIPLIMLKKMSSMPHYIAGFLNLGGRVVPIIDFCQLIEARAAHNLLSTRIILVNDPNPGSERLLGIIGEHVRHFLYARREEFHPIDFNVTPFSFINRIFSRDGEIIQHLDLEEFFKFLSEDLFQPKETHGV